MRVYTSRRTRSAPADQVPRRRRRHQPGRRAAPAVDCRSGAAAAAARRRPARRWHDSRSSMRRLVQEIDALCRILGLDQGPLSEGQGSATATRMEFKDYYATLGVPRPRPTPTSRRPTASWRASTIPTSIPATRRPKPSSRTSTKPTKCSATRTSAGSTTSSARTGAPTSRPGAAAGGPPGGWSTFQEGRRHDVPHDDAGRDAGAVRERRSVLRLLPHVLWRAAERLPRGAAAARGAGRASATRTRRRERRRSHARGSVRRARRGASTIERDGHDRTVEVRIPAGVKDGARVRAAGEGGPAPAAAPPAICFWSCDVLPHPRFERRGQDLYMRARRAGYDRRARRRGQRADARRARRCG